MIKGSDFVFDLLSYTLKSPEWVLNKRATINPKNKDNKCFQYFITVALNHQNIEKHRERISNIKPFLGRYRLSCWNKKLEKI